MGENPYNIKRSFSDLNIIYIGNFIDFLEFGLFTALLPFLSKDLLSQYDPHFRAELGYLAVYIGFMGRPIGAFFLGKLGDLHGSQRLLVFSVLGISITSLMVAFLPNASPHIVSMVLVCRFLQGIFTGAEYSAVVICSTNRKNTNNSYRSVAFMTASGILGVAVAQLIAFVLSLIDSPVLSWRHAFVIVSLIGFVTFLKRALSYQHQPLSAPQPAVSLKPYFPEIIMIVVLVGLANSMFYLVNTFINNYKMIISTNLVASQFLLNLISTASFALIIVCWALYLEKKRYSPARLMKVGLLVMALLLGPLFYAYVQGLSLWINILIQMIFIAGMQLFTLVSISFVPRLFPEAIKVQACGVSFNLGISLLGGSFPYISLCLTEASHNLYMPIVYTFLLLILGNISLRYLISRQSLKNELENISCDYDNKSDGKKVSVSL